MKFNKYLGFALLFGSILQSTESFCVTKSKFEEVVEEIINTIPRSGSTEISQEDSLSKFLRNSIRAGDIEGVKFAIQKGANLNYKRESLKDTPISDSIKTANYSLQKGMSDSDIRLKIVELLIQYGAKINEAVCPDSTALEKVLSSRIPKLPIIRLLLGYGAEITDQAIEIAKNKTNVEEIMKIFAHHQKLLQQAKTNTTKELLTEAIGYNMPYIVQLIVDTNPELVEASDLQLAEVTSPGSVEILKKVLNLAKLKNLAIRTELPNELTELLEKYIAHN